MDEYYISDKGFVETFLRYDNRLNRKRYIKRMLALLAISFIMEFVLITTTDSTGAAEAVVNILTILIVISNWLLMIRRLQDLNKSGWWATGMLIPVLNIALGLYLLFAKGTDGENQYGPDPLEGYNE